MQKKILLLLFTIFAVSIIFPKQSVLIDFNKLKANGNGIDPSQSLAQDDPQMIDYTNHDPVNRRENMPTLIDYSRVAGTSFTEDQMKGMKISLSCYNWEVSLNSSAKFVKNVENTFCTEWHTKAVPVLLEDDTHPPADQPKGFNILAIRVDFPEEAHNCWALVKPPFDIPVFENITTDYKGNKLEDSQIDKTGNKFENGYGVIKNVGTIKRIEMTVYGLNYNNSIAILLQDEKSETREYDFPTRLDFDGWRKIVWKNVNYITRADNRDLFVVPLYPRFEPYIKLNAFRIYRPGEYIGGNFVTYIKDVQVVYDEAVINTDNEPIAHEQVWGILQKKSKEIKAREVKMLGFKQILKFIEQMKMDKSSTSATGTTTTTNTTTTNTTTNTNKK